jgi:hypothetical protein
MSLYSISGIGCDDCESGCGYIGGKKKRTARKAKRQARRAKRKARKTGINCKGAKVKAVVFAPARNAYLALIRLNVKKLAVKLAQATSTNEGKLKVHAKWCKLGGSGAKLQSAIDKAYAKYKRKRGIIGYMDADGGQIGSVAALIASATPIIKALAPLLKTFAPGSKAAEAAETANEISEEITEQTQEHDQEQPQTDGEEIGAIGLNPWLIGAGALAVYYLIKKKRK